MMALFAAHNYRAGSPEENEVAGLKNAWPA
jgi:hypothetical protein